MLWASRPEERQCDSDQRHRRAIRRSLLRHGGNSSPQPGERLPYRVHGSEKRFMSIIDALVGDEERASKHGRIAGVVVGVVTNNQDPDGLGRVKVKFPWLSDTDESHWARMAV